MKLRNGNNFGIVLLSKTLIPIFMNAEAQAFLAPNRGTNGQSSHVEGHSSPISLPSPIRKFAQDLLEWHLVSIGQRSSRKKLLSSVIRIKEKSLQLNGGMFSLTKTSDESYFLITLRLTNEATVNHPPSSHSPLLYKPLTSREHQVVTLLARGYTNHTIASHMAISVHTVKDHLKAIRAKTGAKNKTQILIKLRAI